MIPKATVHVDLDERAMKEYIQEKLSDMVKTQLLYIDVNRAMELTNMSKTFLNDYVLSHPYMKQHERRKDRKRFYRYDKFIEALDMIIEEWN